MNERARAVVELYRVARLEDQLGYYQKRVAEYRKARNQARMTAAMLLVTASVFGALGGADVAGWRPWWAIAAAATGALSAALTSYESAFGFDRLSREYDRARGAVHMLSVELPGSACRRIDGDGERDTAAFVGRIEEALLAQTDQWAKQSRGSQTDQWTTQSQGSQTDQWATQSQGSQAPPEDDPPAEA